MIASIFAVDADGGLGKNGTLPWPRDKEDLAWFKDHTKGHVVVMGRNTWEDPMMPKPLPHRVNCVVSSSTDFQMADKANTILPGHNLDQSLINLQDFFEYRIVWVIGGAQLLKSTAHLIQKVVVTRFDNSYDCDIKLDIENYLANFDLIEEIPANAKRFQIYHAKLP